MAKCCNLFVNSVCDTESLASLLNEMRIIINGLEHKLDI